MAARPLVFASTFALHVPTKTTTPSTKQQKRPTLGGGISDTPTLPALLEYIF
jgi:hypothetical protein